MDTATMKYYYDHGLWTIDRLDKLLVAGKITQEQYILPRLAGKHVCKNFSDNNEDAVFSLWML